MDRFDRDASAQWAKRLMGANVVRRWGPETREVFHSFFRSVVPQELRRVRARPDGTCAEGDTVDHIRCVLIARCEGLLRSLRTNCEQDSCRSAAQSTPAVQGYGKEDVPRTGGASGADISRSAECRKQDAEVPPACERGDL